VSSTIADPSWRHAHEVAPLYRGAVSDRTDIPADEPASGVTAQQVNDFLDELFPGGGSSCESLGDRWAIARFEPSVDNLRPGGIISGPTVFSACDAALYYACFTVIGIEPMVLTSEMSIRFLRPARGTMLRAKATLDHAGRRSLIGTIVAWTDDPSKPVAVAQGTYVAPQ
jgi:acyl-coenzyme A thioesterase PaaI-like protein